MCENNKVICLIVGKNETSILKSLNRREWIKTEDLHQLHMDNPSLYAPSSFSDCINRLHRKGLIIYRCDYKHIIKEICRSEKGQLLLQLLKMK